MSLANKTITIELEDAINTSGKSYIADFGSSLKILKLNGILQCMWITTKNFSCGDSVVESNGGKTLTITIPNTTPTQMVIGNIGVV